MRNVLIEGGKSFGPPKGWDPVLSGECLTITVLQTVEGNAPYQTTAWQFDAAELDALQGGGHLFTSINGQDVPVQRLWVQDQGGTIVGELMADRDPPPLRNAAGQRNALIAICQAFAAKRGLWAETCGVMTTGELIRYLARMVDRVPPASSAIGIPVLTLQDVVTESTRPEASDVVSIHLDKPPEYVDIRLQRPHLQAVFDDLPPPGGTRLRDVSRYATGGPVDPGKSYRVGERSPETSAAGQVLSIDDLCRVLAKSDGLDWDEVCPLEGLTEDELAEGTTECASGTCVSAHFEDHEPAFARSRYRMQAEGIAQLMRSVRSISTPPQSAISAEGMCDQWCDRREGGEHSAACRVRRGADKPFLRSGESHADAPRVDVAANDAPFVRADKCDAPDGETVEVRDPDGTVTTMAVGGQRWQRWLSDIGPGMAVRRLPKPLP